MRKSAKKRVKQVKKRPVKRQAKELVALMGKRNIKEPIVETKTVTVKGEKMLAGKSRRKKQKIIFFRMKQNRVQPLYSLSRVISYGFGKAFYILSDFRAGIARKHFYTITANDFEKELLGIFRTFKW